MYGSIAWKQFNWGWKGKRKKAVCSGLIWIFFHSGAVGRSWKRKRLHWRNFCARSQSWERWLFKYKFKAILKCFIGTELSEPESQGCLRRRTMGSWNSQINNVSELSLETFGSKLFKFYLFYSPSNLNVTPPPTCLVSWDLMRLHRLLPWVLSAFLNLCLCSSYCAHTLSGNFC